MSAANAVYTGPVSVTCTNGTFQTGWDNDNPYFADKGNIAAHYCDIVQHTGYVSDNLTDPRLRWYQGVVIQDTQTAIVETQTVQVQVSQETSTSSSSNQETTTQTDTPVVDSETSTQTSPVVETSTPQSETPSVVVVQDTQTVETLTPVLVPDTQTLTSDTPTSIDTQPVLAETIIPTIPIDSQPLPTPVPVVEPQPVVVEPQPIPQPEPEPVVPVIDEEVPLEELPLEELPVVEEPQPVEEQPEHPVEEETPSIPDVTPSLPGPTPEPLPVPIVEPVQETQPDTPYVPPTVTLDNGVILTQEVAEQVALLQDPGELFSELFTNPAAVFAALGSVGADMSPAARAKSKDAVVQAVVVGSIITQAAGAAAYRRKP